MTSPSFTRASRLSGVMSLILALTTFAVPSSPAQAGLFPAVYNALFGYGPAYGGGYGGYAYRSRSVGYGYGYGMPYQAAYAPMYTAAYAPVAYPVYTGYMPAVDSTTAYCPSCCGYAPSCGCGSACGCGTSCGCGSACGCGSGGCGSGGCGTGGCGCGVASDVQTTQPTYNPEVVRGTNTQDWRASERTRLRSQIENTRSQQEQYQKRLDDLERASDSRDDRDNRGIRGNGGGGSGARESRYHAPAPQFLPPKVAEIPAGDAIIRTRTEPMSVVRQQATITRFVPKSGTKASDLRVAFR